MQHDSEVSLKLEDVSEIIISCKLIKYSFCDFREGKFLLICLNSSNIRNKFWQQSLYNFGHVEPCFV